MAVRRDMLPSITPAVRAPSSRSARALRVVCSALALALSPAIACGVSGDHLGALDGDPGAGSDGVGATADPCDEGEMRTCHVVIDQLGDVVTCLDGEQSCSAAGTWSHCDGSISGRPIPTASDSPEPDSAPYAKPLSLTNQVSCKANPCDPTCKVWDEIPDGGVSSQGALVPSYQQGSTASIPTGFVAKGIKSPCATVADCQFDEVCTNKVCVPWTAGATDPACATADLTLGVPCTGAIPVCNRGNTVAPAGVNVFLYAGNESKFPTCGPSVTTPAVKAKCKVSKAIAPGACVNVVESDCVNMNGNGAVLSGNQSVMVNPPVGAAAGQIAECHCENNWSDYHSGACSSVNVSTYAPVTYKQTYTGSCPIGTKLTWNLLTYDATTPGDASIVFKGHTADSVAALPSALTTLVTAKAFPLPDTQKCTAGGPSPCPIRLHENLTSPMADVLELVILVNPTSNGLAAPTLNSWSVTYSCPPSE